MLEEGQGLCRWSAVCHFMVEQVFGGAFEEAMRWYAFALMKGGNSLLVQSRLCIVQRILPLRRCA